MYTWDESDGDRSPSSQDGLSTGGGRTRPHIWRYPRGTVVVAPVKGVIGHRQLMMSVRGGTGGLSLGKGYAVCPSTLGDEHGKSVPNDASSSSG